MLHLAHTSDFHWGRVKHSSIDPKTGLQTSLVNDMETFHEFISVAEESGVKYFVMAGDVFDKIHVSNAVRQEAARAIARILQTMDLYVIVGTHDRAHDKYAAHTLSDWQQLARAAAEFSSDNSFLSRLHIFDHPESIIVKDPSGKEEGQIIAIPEPTKGILEGKTYLEHVKEIFDSFELREDIPVLVIAHFAVFGAKKGDEVLDVASLNPDESVPAGFFDGLKAVDYVALGHIHQRQELGATGKVVYPGSINYCSFSEIDEKKGGYIVRISDDKKLEKRFIELKSPIPLKEIRIDVIGEDFPMDVVRQKISQNADPRAIVKVVLKIKEEDVKKIDRAEINSFLNKSTVSSSFSLDVDRTSALRDRSLTQTASEDESFKTYLARLKLEKEAEGRVLKKFDYVMRKVIQMEQEEA